MADAPQPEDMLFSTLPTRGPEATQPLPGQSLGIIPTGGGDLGGGNDAVTMMMNDMIAQAYHQAQSQAQMPWYERILQHLAYAPAVQRDPTFGPAAALITGLTNTPPPPENKDPMYQLAALMSGYGSLQKASAAQQNAQMARQAAKNAPPGGKVTQTFGAGGLSTKIESPEPGKIVKVKEGSQEVAYILGVDAQGNTTKTEIARGEAGSNAIESIMKELPNLIKSAQSTQSITTNPDGTMTITPSGESATRGENQKRLRDVHIGITELRRLYAMADPSTTGLIGTMKAHAQNAEQQFLQGAQVFGYDPKSSGLSNETRDFYFNPRRPALETLAISSAYRLANAQNRGGRVSDNDFKKALEQITGGSMSNSEKEMKARIRTVIRSLTDEGRILLPESGLNKKIVNPKTGEITELPMTWEEYAPELAKPEGAINYDQIEKVQ